MCVCVCVCVCVLKSIYLGSNLLFKQVLLKTMEQFIIFYFIFSKLLDIFSSVGT